MYFLCVKKTIEQFYRNRCLFISKVFVMAYSSVQNILFYNKCLNEAKTVIFCCCLATKNV